MDKQKLHIISTKILSPSSIKKLEDNGISALSYEAVSIEYKKSHPLVNNIENSSSPLVFTSKNGVKSAELLGLKPRNAYAIEPVTSAFAKEKQFNILKTAKNGKELAETIASNKETEVFHLCSTIRRTELKNGLTSQGIKIHEIESYSKKLNARKFDLFTGLVIFAPSQLDAFLLENKIDKETIYCIGKTTAVYASSKGFFHVKYCEISSESHLIDLAIQDMTNE